MMVREGKGLVVVMASMVWGGGVAVRIGRDFVELECEVASNG